MAETLSGIITSKSQFLQSSTGSGITYNGRPTKSYARTFTSVDVTKLYVATLTVTTTPTTIDVTNLTDAFGVALNFATVKQLQVINNDATNNLTVGGGSNALLAALPVLVGQNPSTGSTGSCVNLTTNLTVTGTTKIIQLVASAGSITVDVVIAGS